MNQQKTTRTLQEQTSSSSTPQFLPFLLVIMLAACGGGGGDDGGGEEEVAGLDARPANLGCIAPARPVGPDILGVEGIFADAWGELGAITKILKEPGGTDRWFVLDRVHVGMECRRDRSFACNRRQRKRHWWAGLDIPERG
ncbi:MAG: hypothetical protein QGF90_08735 [Gammaproteobacteria bacterium]|nr:hypothetical protein [Gammaproteobacteria bacterium]